MSEDDNQAGGSYGQLMEYLLSERSHYLSEEEFKAFAVNEVRRFINDLRKIDIELTLRPTYLEKSPSDSQRD